MLILVLVITAILIVQNSASSGELHTFTEGAPHNLDYPALSSPTNQAILAAKATATFGAEQFYLQLTALAGDN